MTEWCPSRVSPSAPTNIGDVVRWVAFCSLRKDDGNDHTVETEGLTEDENKNHANEDCFLLSVGSNTSVTNNTNSKTSSEGGETAGQSGGEVLVSLTEGVAGAGSDYKRTFINIPSLTSIMTSTI